MSVVNPRIPLTIIGGFLGSGKTTLLNHILNNADGRKFAVVVNDFGAINIDAGLVVAVEGETIALANGCICCAIRDDLVSEVLRLCRQKEPPDHIVIEASGVSKPVAIVESFFRPEVRQCVDVQTIVTLLDANHVVDDAATYADIAYAQIAVADMVVINKADLVTGAQLAKVRARAEQIVPRARIIETSHGRIPASLLFDHAVSAAAQDLRAGGRRILGLGDRHTGQDFAAWSYRDDARSFSFSAIQRMVEQLPQQIYRGKGVIRLALASGDVGVFQLAGRRGTLKLVKPTDKMPPATELVFIGHPGATTETGLAELIDHAWSQANNRATPHIVTDLRAFQVEFV